MLTWLALVALAQAAEPPPPAPGSAPPPPMQAPASNWVPPPPGTLSPPLEPQDAGTLTPPPPPLLPPTVPPLSVDGGAADGGDDRLVSLDGGAGDGGTRGLLPASMTGGGKPEEDAKSTTDVIGAAVAPAQPKVKDPLAVSLRGAAEAQVSVLPSGTPGGGLDGYASLRPVAGFGVGEFFSIEVGPEFRLLVFDSAPANRAEAFNGVLRREDWDELSDFGQFLSSLKIAPDNSVLTLRAGVIRKKTLGLGHLINRYSNQDNPNYHPAGATAVLSLGPVRAEVFASDILALRILSAAVSWDIGRTFSSSPDLADRYLLTLEGLYDAGKNGLPRIGDTCNEVSCTLLDANNLSLALLELDASAVVLRTSLLRIMLLAGFGSRANTVGNVGFLGGAAFDVSLQEVALGLKVELRKQAGGFRQGMVGPNYELARFSSIGLSSTPLGIEQLPDSLSVYVEARTAIGSLITVDGYVESFIWGRIDFDAMAQVNLIDNKLVATGRFSAFGLGVQPRYAASGGLRWRLFPSFYVMGSGGTVFFPQTDGSLVRGITISAGAGVDFER